MSNQTSNDLNDLDRSLNSSGADSDDGDHGLGGKDDNDNYNVGAKLSDIDIYDCSTLELRRLSMEVQ